MNYLKNKKILLPVCAVAGTALITVNVVFAASFVGKTNKRKQDLINVQKTIERIDVEYETNKNELFLGTTDFKEGSRVTFEDLGMGEIVPYGNARIFRTISEIDAYKGFLTIDVTINSGSVTEKVYFVVKGFKSETDYYEENAAASIVNVGTDIWVNGNINVATLPTKTSNWEQIGLTKPEGIFEEFNADLTKITTSDQNKGKVTYQLSLTKEMSNETIFIKSVNINVHGYVTGDVIMDGINTSLRSLTAAITSTKDDANVNEIFIKPAMDTYTKDELKLIIPGSAFSNYTITFKPVTKDHINGEVTGNLFCELSGRTSNRLVKVTGFETQDRTDIRTLKNWFPKQPISTSRKNITASVAAREGQTITFVNLGIDAPLEQFGCEITMTVIEVAQNIGTVKVRATISKAGVSSTADFTVKDFAIPGQSEVDFFFDQIKDEYITSKASQTATDVAGTISLTVEDLGISSFPSAPTTLRVTILKSSINASAGEILVNVIVSKPGTPASREKNVTIKGFKTS